MPRARLAAAEGPNDQQGNLRNVKEDLVQELHRAPVGPVQVFEEDDQRSLRIAQVLEKASYDHKEPLVFPIRLQFHQGWALSQDILHERVEAQEYFPKVAGFFPYAFTDHPLSLRVVMLEYPQVGVHGVPEGSIGGLVLSGEALAADEGTAPLRGDAVPELVHQTSLPHARLALHEADPPPSLPGALEGALQGAVFPLPADEVGPEVQLDKLVIRTRHEGKVSPLEPLQVPLEPPGALVALLRLLFQELQDDAVQDDGQPVVYLRRRGGYFRDMLVDDGAYAVAGEGKSAGQKLVHDNAQGVEVAPLVDAGLDDTGLFGGHVAEGAHHLVLAGNHRQVLHLGEAEVDDLHLLPLFRRRHHDVSRLQVPVDDMLFMDMGQGLAYLFHDVNGGIDLKGESGLQEAV